MSRSGAVLKADVRRAVQGALEGIIAAGLSPDNFEIIHKNGELHVLPANANAPLDDAADLERRMKDAFGA